MDGIFMHDFLLSRHELSFYIYIYIPAPEATAIFQKTLSRKFIAIHEK
jgi:hypothetical protein